MHFYSQYNNQRNQVMDLKHHPLTDSEVTIADNVHSHNGTPLRHQENVNIKFHILHRLEWG